MKNMSDVEQKLNELKQKFCKKYENQGLFNLWDGIEQDLFADIKDAYIEGQKIGVESRQEIIDELRKELYGEKI